MLNELRVRCTAEDVDSQAMEKLENSKVHTELKFFALNRAGVAGMALSSGKDQFFNLLGRIDPEVVYVPGREKMSYLRFQLRNITF
ncbi:hypothetical protein RUM43_000278 [Polyplax serrata]|uniref:Uncharacterized protein n=1 Tax=Polyplax serrata TaxID=468196 RepID=A0AAN8SC95_POLSC